jgi:hypothetical protein
MIRPAILISAILLGASACSNAADEQNKANEAQREANDKIAAAARESTQKAADAQANADKKIAQAQADFTKMREDYRHSTAENLTDLDRKIDLLETKARQSSGQAKSDLDNKLKRIHAQRLAFNDRNATLDRAAATTWDDTKARVERQWVELRDLVSSS